MKKKFLQNIFDSKETEVLSFIEKNDINFTVDQTSPLHLAAQCYNGRIFTAVLKHTKNINLQNKNGNTALHLAVKCGYEHAVRKLIQHSADQTVKNNEGYTPLDLCRKLHAEGCRLQKIINLLEHNENCFNYKNELLLAVDDDDISFAKELIEIHKLSADGSNTDFNSLFFVKSIQMAKVLLEHGANVNFISRRKDTPLHHAAESQNYELAKLYIEYGADKNAVNDKNWTPLSIIRYFEKNIKHINYKKFINLFA